MPDIPKNLQSRIERVTVRRYQEGRAAFKQERVAVVTELRARGVEDIEICRMLGFTEQYMYKAFPKMKESGR